MPESALQAAVAEFERQADKLHEDIVNEAKARVVRNRIVNRIFRTLVAVLVVMALAGGFAWNYVVTNNHQRSEQIAANRQAIAAVTHETAVREYEQCVARNDGRATLKKDLEGLVRFALSSFSSTSPEGRARGRAFLAAYSKMLDHEHPAAHCAPVPR